MKITFNQVSIQLGGKKILDNILFCMEADENWAITGPSGSGKSSLAKAICNKLFFSGTISFGDIANKEAKPRCLLIEQQHQFKNRSNVSNFYYQQRFNSCDATDSLTVLEELGETQPLQQEWIGLLGLTELLDKPIIQLSNGENKRLQLAKALHDNPDILVLDNPFTGLDTLGRDTLSQILNQLSAKGIKIILIAELHDLPSCIHKIAHMEDGKIKECSTNSIGIVRVNKVKPELPVYKLDELQQLFSEPITHFREAIRMEEVSITYNGKCILDKINWTVKKGERWSVSGPNGSGKSTLLSLVNADNPQAYANDIWLFDKKRGTGESIWDIKKNIGFVSPELHLCFEKGISVFDAVASGLYDTIGLFRNPGKTEKNTINQWLDILQLNGISMKWLHQLSLGQQRLVMLARALVKCPPLLILDEPCQGLDDRQTNGFKSLIEAICKVSDTSLVYVSHYAADKPASLTHELLLKAGKIESINQLTTVKVVPVT
jgi:molybdate transport system ATP-binding protein